MTADTDSYFQVNLVNPCTRTMLAHLLTTPDGQKRVFNERVGFIFTAEQANPAMRRLSTKVSRIRNKIRKSGKEPPSFKLGYEQRTLASLPPDAQTETEFDMPHQPPYVRLIVWRDRSSRDLLSDALVEMLT